MCSCSGSKLPGKTRYNLWPRMRFSFPLPPRPLCPRASPPPPPPPPCRVVCSVRSSSSYIPDDKTFPTPLSRSAGLARVYIVVSPPPQPRSIAFFFSFFFRFYFLFLLLKNGQKKRKKKREIINKRHLGAINIYVFIRCGCMTNITHRQQLA